jgi:hypothetical protein
MFNSADQHAYVTQFLPKSHQISPIPYARRDYAPQTLPQTQKTELSSLSGGSNLASLSIGREKGEGVLTSFATGGACTAGLVERVSLEDQTVEEEAEDDEAQRKSTTITRPRTATTASATRCFGGRAFAAGLAMGGRLG